MSGFLLVLETVRLKAVPFYEESETFKSVPLDQANKLPLHHCKSNLFFALF